MEGGLRPTFAHQQLSRIYWKGLPRALRGEYRRNRCKENAFGLRFADWVFLHFSLNSTNIMYNTHSTTTILCILQYYLYCLQLPTILTFLRKLITYSTCSNNYLHYLQLHTILTLLPNSRYSLQKFTQNCSVNAYTANNTNSNNNMKFWHYDMCIDLLIVCVDL